MTSEKNPPASPVVIAEVDVPLHAGASARAWLVLPHLSAVTAQYDPESKLHQVRVLFPHGWDQYGLNQGAAEILAAWEAYVAAQQPPAGKNESSKSEAAPAKHKQGDHRH